MQASARVTCRERSVLCRAHEAGRSDAPLGGVEGGAEDIIGPGARVAAAMSTCAEAQVTPGFRAPGLASAS